MFSLIQARRRVRCGVQGKGESWCVQGGGGGMRGRSGGWRLELGRAVSATRL